MTDIAAKLKARIQDRRAAVAVIGLGYVGLPLVRRMHEAGFKVVGYDQDGAKIAMLREGRTYLHHLGEELVAELAASERFTPTMDPDDLRAADAIILCVPTPLGPHREPDMTYIAESTKMVAAVLRPGHLVCLESTTYPGTTQDGCKPLLEAAGLACGSEFFLAYSPEREDPGSQGVEGRAIPKLVGGVDRVSTELARALYGAAVEEVIAVDRADVAEAAKLLENIYRAVNIALVNELKPVFRAMDIDIWKVIEAAATKPFGFQPFYPGPGLGGHCIPIDPFYLTWKAREFGHHTRFIELAGEINSAMPRQVVERTVEGLNETGKPVRGARVLVCGLAYKPDIDDVRETPAAEIITLLIGRGADVSYHDPHVPVFGGMRHYDLNMRSVELTAEALRGADCVVIVTNHKAIDWQLIAQEASVVVDTRNAMAPYRPIAGLLVQS